jgi:hypothetical protein
MHAFMLLAVVVLFWAPDARASDRDLVCLAAADAVIAVGGVVGAVGMQVALLDGKPSKRWAIVGGSLGIANAIGGAALLIASLVVDDDVAEVLAVVGLVQLGIAVSDGVGVAAIEMARSDALVIPSSSSSSAGLSLGFAF